MRSTRFAAGSPSTTSGSNGASSSVGGQAARRRAVRVVMGVASLGGRVPPHAGAAQVPDAPLRLIPHAAVEQLLRDDQAMDLVRALVDLGPLGVAHQALDRVVARVTRAAVDLDRVGGDLHGGVRGVHLGHAARCIDRPAGVTHAGRAPGEEPRRLDAGRGIGEHGLDHLLVGDRPAELAPLQRIASRACSSAARASPTQAAAMLIRPEPSAERATFRPSSLVRPAGSPRGRARRRRRARRRPSRGSPSSSRGRPP